MPKLGIIIINYNAPEDTLECIRSVEKYAGNLDPILLVYDNSDYNELQTSDFEEFNLAVHFTRNPQNKGFAGAVNQGLSVLQQENYTYFFLLNNDVLLVDDSIRKMVAWLDKHKNVSIVGGINYLFKRPGKIWQSGFDNNFLTGGVNARFPEVDVLEVDYVPGSTLMGRMEIINGIGFFDEQFFHYFEENDFCKRVKDRGGKVAVLANTKFLHKADDRDRKGSTFIFYYMTRNQLIFFSKHLIVFQRIIPFFWLHLYNFLRALKYDFLTENKLKFRFVKTYWLATTDFWKGKTGKSEAITK